MKGHVDVSNRPDSTTEKYPVLEKRNANPPLHNLIDVIDSGERLFISDGGVDGDGG
jgi:hypothetical protein